MDTSVKKPLAPVGYEVLEYRVPRDRELYLTTGGSVARAHWEYHIHNGAADKARWVVRKK
jgi:hypothetical protein